MPQQIKNNSKRLSQSRLTASKRMLLWVVIIVGAGSIIGFAMIGWSLLSQLDFSGWLDEAFSNKTEKAAQQARIDVDSLIKNAGVLGKVEGIAKFDKCYSQKQYAGFSSYQTALCDYTSTTWITTDQEYEAFNSSVFNFFQKENIDSYDPVDRPRGQIVPCYSGSANIPAANKLSTHMAFITIEPAKKTRTSIGCDMPLKQENVQNRDSNIEYRLKQLADEGTILRNAAIRKHTVLIIQFSELYRAPNLK